MGCRVRGKTYLDTDGKNKVLSIARDIGKRKFAEQQLKELEQVIDAVDCDFVLSGTPIDITRVVKVNKPIIRVRYELEEQGGTKKLAELIEKAVKK